jgi:streptogramin lyase
MLSARGRGEEGFVIAGVLILIAVTAVVVGVIAVLLFANGAEVRSQSQGQVAQSLADGVVGAESTIVRAGFPKNATQAYTASCTSSNYSSSQCPSATTITGLKVGATYGVAVSWQVSIYDNASPYGSRWDSSGQSAGLAQWDQNGDRKVWAVGQASVGSITRTRAALVTPTVAGAPLGFTEDWPITTASSGPYGVAAGPDGNLWVTESSASKIARVTTAGQVSEFSTPSASSQPYGIAPGPDGNIWFTELQANKVAKITPAGTITEYPVPTASAGPAGITAGPDGNLWFTESQANAIGQITPAGVINEFALPTASAAPQAITSGSDGNLWFTEQGSGQVGMLSPTTTPTNPGFVTGMSNPGAVVVDGAHIFWRQGTTIGRANIDGSGVNASFLTGVGNILRGASSLASDGTHIYWANGSGGISRANVDGSGVNASFIASAGGNPNGLVVDASHIYWSLSSAIGRANIDGSAVNTSFLSNVSSGFGITSMADDGSHIYWAPGSASGSIGRANVDGSGVNASFLTPGSGAVNALAADSVHVFWRASAGSVIGRANVDGSAINGSYLTGLGGNALADDGARIYWGNTKWGTLTAIGRASALGPSEYALPSGSAASPSGIAAGPDGKLWVAETGANKVASVTTSGQASEYAVPTSASQPSAITAGPDGNLWFTEYGADQIGRITTAGTITELPGPSTGAGSRGIALGPDGNLWFAEYSANAIGLMAAGL